MKNVSQGTCVMGAGWMIGWLVGLSACDSGVPIASTSTYEDLNAMLDGSGVYTDSGDASTEAPDPAIFDKSLVVDTGSDSMIEPGQNIEEPPLPPPLSHFYRLQVQAMEARREACGVRGLAAVVLPEGLVEHLTTRVEYTRHKTCLARISGLPCASTPLVKGNLESVEDCLYHEPQEWDVLDPPAPCPFTMDAFTYDVRRERFSLNNAYFLLYLSILSKLKSSAQAMDALAPLGYLEGIIIKGSRVAILYAEHEDHAVLAFKGSTSLADYVSDANYRMVDESKSGVPGKVHQGFSNSLNTDWKAIVKIIDKAVATGKPVVFTGHSMGGALAQLAALKADLMQGIAVRSVYMFAAPRVGNEAYADAYMAALGDVSFRINNGMDMTPHMFPAAGSEQVAKQAMLSVLSDGGFGSVLLGGFLDMIFKSTDYTQVGDELWIDPQGDLYGVLDDDSASDHAFWAAAAEVFDGMSIAEIRRAQSGFHNDLAHLCYQARFVEQLLYLRD